MTILTAAILAALLALSHGIMKWISINIEGGFVLGVLKLWPQLGAALAIYFFIFLYYIHALRDMKLAALYPLYTGLSVIFVFGLGVFRYSETVTTTNVLGCAMIAVGVALVAS